VFVINTNRSFPAALKTLAFDGRGTRHSLFGRSFSVDFKGHAYFRTEFNLAPSSITSIPKRFKFIRHSEDYASRPVFANETDFLSILSRISCSAAPIAQSSSVSGSTKPPIFAYTFATRAHRIFAKHYSRSPLNRSTSLIQYLFSW
jgi:hypothetical protein